MSKTQRQFYIDNLRIVLTSLVVLHHLAIAYGGPGLWYYNEPNTSTLTTIILSLFVATNQSFFMGMFFMISAFFLHKSIKRKSKKNIFLDRIKRLGIPIIFYAFIISPIIVFLLTRYDDGIVLSVVEFYNTTHWLTFGPLWFIAALLLFTFFALLFNTPCVENTVKRPLPKWYVILSFALLLAILSFVLRIWFPVGWSLPPFGFQLGHFGQYIPLYIIGFCASKNEWFDQITIQHSKGWLVFVAIGVFILFPLVFYFGGALRGDTEVFMGGTTIQSLVYCVWEQVVGVSIMIGLLGVFKEYLNYQKNAWKEYSSSAYTVYIIHAFILVVLSLILKEINLPTIVKFILLAPISLFLCFFIGLRIRKIPFARNVL